MLRHVLDVLPRGLDLGVDVYTVFPLVLLPEDSEVFIGDVGCVNEVDYVNWDLAGDDVILFNPSDVLIVDTPKNDPNLCRSNLHIRLQYL